ncbi:MAG: hypothetical protein LC754_09245 [Acidobacteria bacterium]|nr:hypothetical protein [Acidobacteriota bacterium]
MHEQTLRDFFDGAASAAELARDIEGSVSRSGIVSKVSIEDMTEVFTVSSAMAVRLCDAVLSGELPAADLQTIGFALLASDNFEWDGDTEEVLANVLSDWSAPEINYPLTTDYVRKFRRWLMREQPYPAKHPLATVEGGNIISVTEKKSRRSC